MTQSSDNAAKSPIQNWLDFEHLRKDMETHVHDLELSNFNLQYGSKDEKDFRRKLREVRILLEKIEEIVGPEKVTATHVS